MHPLIQVKESNDDWNTCLDENSLQLGRCVYACNGDRNCELTYFESDSESIIPVSFTSADHEYLKLS